VQLALFLYAKGGICMRDWGMARFAVWGTDSGACMLEPATGWDVAEYLENTAIWIGEGDEPCRARLCGASNAKGYVIGL